MNLYRCAFKVKPSPTHPKYGDPQYAELKFAIVHILLMEFFTETAASRATAILRELPYEQVIPGAHVYNETDGEAKGFLPYGWIMDCMVQAYTVGFSFYVEPWRPAKNETPTEADFIAAPMAEWKL